MKRSREDYEKSLGEIIGKRIKKILYFGIDYEGKDDSIEDYKFDSFCGHHVDFGCDLEMEDGSIFSFFWDNEYICYGLGVFRETLSEMLRSYSVSDVSHEPEWGELIGNKIVGVETFWSWIDYGETTEKQYYPQDVELKFENEFSIYFSASEFSQKDEQILLGSCNTVCVIFGKENAKQYKIGEYAPLEATY